MATFTYIAKRPDGAETRGTINSANADAAREELRKRGLLIEDLREQPALNRPPQEQQLQKPAQPKPQQNQQRQPQQSKPAQAKPTQQQQARPAIVQQVKPSVPTAEPAQPKKPAPLPWSGAQNGAAPKLPDTESYAPLHETLRIFAGWLLAWYGLIYALGFLEQSGKLPPIPFIHELFISPLVLQFTFGTFLLLALSNVHRWIGKGALAGFFLGIVYVALLAGFVLYG